MSKSRIRVGAVAGAVLLVGALTACSGGQPGAAAVVHEDHGDRVVPVSDVDVAARELGSAFQGVSPATMLGVLIQEPVFQRYAEDNGVGVSSGQVDAQIATLLDQSGGDQDQELSEASRTIVRYTLEIAALNELPDITTIAPDLNAELAAQSYTISPRYGTETADGTIAATSYPWIVPTGTDDPAATAQP